MFETYRMLGREHEADLAREAAKQTRAAEARDASASRRRSSKAWALMTRLARSTSPRAPVRGLRRERRHTS
jgi:hypothetical protein